MLARSKNSGLNFLGVDFRSYARAISGAKELALLKFPYREFLFLRLCHPVSAWQLVRPGRLGNSRSAF